MARTNTITFWIVLGVMLPTMASSEAFLAKTPSMFLDGIVATDGASLLREIEGLFGPGSTSPRLERIESALRPVFLSMTGQGQTRLGATAARYVLHRYFDDNHGWMVTGLAPDGGSWNSSSPLAILHGRVPSFLVQLFEDHLLGDGVDLHELVLLVATFEHIVRIETVSRLDFAFEAMQIPAGAKLTEMHVDQLLDTVMLYNYFSDVVRNDSAFLRSIYSDAVLYYPNWEDTQLFLRDTRRSVLFTERDVTNGFVKQEFNYNTVLHLAEMMNDKYGHFQDEECQHLKHTLLAHEHKGTGRVKLSKFYGLGRAGLMQFSEKPEFLRDLGLLDESGAEASVIVPNWLYSTANCLGNSKLYSICCINECNAIMGHLERDFASPTALPEQLARAVSSIATSTVAAPRNLSSSLLVKLEAIAATHGGQVPIHGRLFAQWLHHAYPRECPYPHAPEAFKPVDAYTWVLDTGAASAVLMPEELAMHGELLPGAHSREDEFDVEHWHMDEDVELPGWWTDDEELLVSPHWGAAFGAQSWLECPRTALRATAMVGTLLGTAVAMMKTATTAALAPCEKNHFV